VSSSSSQTGDVPAAPAQPLLAKPDGQVEVGRVQQGARVKVVTDVLSAEIDANGGDIRSLLLTHYRQDEDANQPFVLFEEKTGRNYFAQTGFVGDQLPSHKTVFQLTPGEYRLRVGLYNADTGERLPVSSGGVAPDYFILPLTLTVQP